jgi:hypothetical protein
MPTERATSPCIESEAFMQNSKTNNRIRLHNLNKCLNFLMNKVVKLMLAIIAIAEEAKFGDYSARLVKRP